MIPTTKLEGVSNDKVFIEEALLTSSVPPRRSARPWKPSARLCSLLDVQRLQHLKPASKRKRSSSPDSHGDMPTPPHKRSLRQCLPLVLSDTSSSSENSTLSSASTYSASTSASSPSTASFPAPPTPVYNQPAPIRLLRPIHSNLTIPTKSSTFTLTFLKLDSKGKPLTDSIYQSSDPTSSMIEWRLFGSTYQPFLPRTPGHHGAGLTPFLPQSPPSGLAEGGVPLFIGTAAAGYTYFGHYREPKLAEPLTLEELEKVPGWAKRHFEREAGRMESPGWVERGLREALFGAAVKGRLAEVERIRMCAKMVERKAMPPVAMSGPKLQLFWEYLECIGFDTEFYQALVEKQNRFKVEPLLFV